jgi:sugar phosphate isomerase/epimerase
VSSLCETDLVFCVGNAPHVPLLERLSPARAAGYAALSLLPYEYTRLRESGMSDTEIRQRIADQGLAVGELDGLAVWLPDHRPPASLPSELARLLADATPERLVPIAAAVGARSITVIEFFGRGVDDLDEAAESFARACDLAAEYGVLLHLEFLPWAGIPDLATAAEIVRRAGRPNGGLLVDSWHLYRSGSTLEELSAIPGDLVMAVQLDDAPARPEPDLADETEHRRLLPGEGSFDLVGLVRTLDEIGSRAPLGVEVLSDELARRPVDEIARRTAEATRRVLAEARGGAG